jgi:hypothetical protein
LREIAFTWLKLTGKKRGGDSREGQPTYFMVHLVVQV